jgi:small ligand-binding sensory domain FIST
MTASSAARAITFRAGHAPGADWRTAVEGALSTMGPAPSGANLGFAYLSDRFAADAGDILEHLRRTTRIDQWTGTVGIGVLASGIEYMDEPAIALMVGALPDGEFSVFSGRARPPALGSRTASGAEAAHFAVVHADPETPDLPELIEDMSGKVATGYLVGGLSSARGAAVQIANGVLQGGLSGVVLSSRIDVRTRHTQGCRPIGPHRVVTGGERNIVASLDGRPALEVLKADMGDPLAGDFRRAVQSIHAALPVAASDTGDYMVRNLVGIDPRRGLVAIGAPIEEGMQLMFCRRDADAAREDLERMLEAVAGELDGPPKGGLYYSCLGRGEHLFGARSTELGIIRARLGDFPLVGFFCNGEISHDGLYGYTGVLALFR